MTLPIIAITPGDAAGIGPEVLVKALADPATHKVARPLVIADADVVNEALRTVGIPLLANVIEKVEDARFTVGTLDILNTPTGVLPQIKVGKPSAAGGKAAAAWLERAVGMALQGQAQAVVAGPVHGEALRLAGFKHRSQGEMAAAITGTRTFATLLISGPVRIGQVTSRLPLREVPAAIDKVRVLSTVKLVRQALNDLGIAEPRIGVAGLNPDIGNPALCRECYEEILPAVQAARDLGFNVEGPLPAALLAARLVRGYYDAGVAMYDDQAQIAVMAHNPGLDDWGRGVAVAGVDVTIGLPIIAVSVGHGPAFDIAGQGIANGRALVEAIGVAAEFAAHRLARR
jgi:4-hydroxythreonine-4-phosphate dehydrogenase